MSRRSFFLVLAAVLVAAVFATTSLADSSRPPVQRINACLTGSDCTIADAGMLDVTVRNLTVTGDGGPGSCINCSATTYSAGAYYFSPVDAGTLGNCATEAQLVYSVGASTKPGHLCLCVMDGGTSGVWQNVMTGVYGTLSSCPESL